MKNRQFIARLGTWLIKDTQGQLPPELHARLRLLMTAPELTPPALTPEEWDLVNIAAGQAFRAKVSAALSAAVADG